MPPCPHFDVKIIQRSKRQSAVASAAYQSGERLFSEYDQKQKYYSHKSEIVHTEIMLPPHAPPEYADRNTLWNAAEAIEKQWNSQLARRFVLAIPRELPPEQYADLIRDYVLISLLSALHEGEWTLSQVEGSLQMLFDRQYILTERVEVETRYDSDDEPYSWYICYVTLENKNLSHLPVSLLSEEQMSRYSIYMSTLGNRPDLFPDSPYVDKYITNPPEGYEVPGEYLDDETFAAIFSEAEKYIGYPYVWGGSSPSTSFDCSGYVSWVINHSGWNVGRLGAQGLYNICTPTSSPRPGNLVFFKGTYDTPGVSHCGIYVGDGRMLHCGDPIGYANLNTSYWQSHFYAYGRLP